ncbi:MAG: STM4014 family protein [Acetatifactor sp.]|nr:STM4014 family protein [Acetatifactor sp.]
MRRACLLGNPDTKRTIYLQQAAARTGLPLLFLDWREFQKVRELALENQLFLKVDPPLWDSCRLEELDALTEAYNARLEELAHIAQSGGHLEFLNHPLELAAVLDKRACKARLAGAALPVTELLEGAGISARDLLERMREKRIFQVFIKPVTGSGAAGVSAFRWQPSTGKMALYTCALAEEGGGLVNTKKLRRFSGQEEIFLLLDRLLGLDCIVERWYAKAEYGGMSYDLRAVVQEDRVDFLLGRLSSGPVTNLHLNNRPLEVSALGLPGRVLEEIQELCRRCMACCPGLSSAGIDILLEKGTLRPRIIEMNGQGDLIYQDIFHDNIIYRRQAELMRRWLERP